MGSQNSTSSVVLQDRLPQPLHSLIDLAFNFWWSWSPEPSLFADIDFEKWEQYCHNPVKLLKAVSDERLTQLATDPYYCDRLQAAATQFEQYMQETNTWASAFTKFSAQQPIAYFSIEFGIHTCLPTYSGGLGILAADHLKSASDLGLPVVGVSLLYRQGYFQQRLNSEGWQEELNPEHQFEQLPLERCFGQHGQELTVTVQIGDRPVKAQVWLARVGRVNLYLLDTNRADNNPADRGLTDQLYGGGRENRIAQEYLLGIGGVSLLQCLGLEPQVYHLNEGHAAFALLELARQEINRTGQSFEQVKNTVRDRCIFTTHTPVPAGHDTFTPELIERYFSHYWSQLGLSREEFLNLGNHLPEKFGEPFNMTVLALRLCRAANGVSKLNGEVCRQMWSVLYPGRPVEQVPIGQITNGVHARTWVAPLMADLYAQHLQPDWAAHITDPQMWSQVDRIPDKEIWQRHRRLKQRLIAYVRFRVQQARINRGEVASSIAAAENLLDPDVLTLGFARRFSTYKRGDLIIHDLKRVQRIFSDSQRPMQIVFAGKAHPADEESKHIIQRLIQWSHDSDNQERIVFIEDYDMHIAQKLIQGVDVWLNTPQRPKEASGTSGQKVCLNGGINCSILDGWWYEAYQVGPGGKGLNGWAINSAGHDDDPEQQNQQDADALYTLLEQEIIPSYYDQDQAGLPRRWIQMMKNSIRTLAPQFNTDRMVMEYVTQMYVPNARDSLNILRTG